MKKEQMRELVSDLKQRQKWFAGGKREKRFDVFWKAWILPSLNLLEKELRK